MSFAESNKAASIVPEAVEQRRLHQSIAPHVAGHGMPWVGDQQPMHSDRKGEKYPGGMYEMPPSLAPYPEALGYMRHSDGRDHPRLAPNVPLSSVPNPPIRGTAIYSSASSYARSRGMLHQNPPAFSAFTGMPMPGPDVQREHLSDPAMQYAKNVHPGYPHPPPSYVYHPSVPRATPPFLSTAALKGVDEKWLLMQNSQNRVHGYPSLSPHGQPQAAGTTSKAKAPRDNESAQVLNANSFISSPPPPSPPSSPPVGSSAKPEHINSKPGGHTHSQSHSTFRAGQSIEVSRSASTESAGSTSKFVPSDSRPRAGSEIGMNESRSGSSHNNAFAERGSAAASRNQTDDNVKKGDLSRTIVLEEFVPVWVLQPAHGSVVTEHDVFVNPSHIPSRQVIHHNPSYKIRFQIEYGASTIPKLLNMARERAINDARKLIAKLTNAEQLRPSHSQMHGQSMMYSNPHSHGEMMNLPTSQSVRSSNTSYAAPQANSHMQPGPGYGRSHPEPNIDESDQRYNLPPRPSHFPHQNWQETSGLHNVPRTNMFNGVSLSSRPVSSKDRSKSKSSRSPKPATDIHGHGYNMKTLHHSVKLELDSLHEISHQETLAMEIDNSYRDPINVHDKRELQLDLQSSDDKQAAPAKKCKSESGVEGWRKLVMSGDKAARLSLSEATAILNIADIDTEATTDVEDNSSEVQRILQTLAKEVKSKSDKCDATAGVSDTSLTKTRGSTRAAKSNGESEKEKDVEAAKEQDESDLWVQCDKCHKWRRLPPRSSPLHPATLPNRWYCRMNTWEPERATCDVAQENYKPASSGVSMRSHKMRVWVRRLKSMDRFEIRSKGHYSRDNQRECGQVDWLRCANPHCGKWRATLRNIDGSRIKDKNPIWYCWMNSWDDARSSCSAPQECTHVRSYAEPIPSDDEPDVTGVEEPFAEENNTGYAEVQIQGISSKGRIVRSRWNRRRRT